MIATCHVQFARNEFHGKQNCFGGSCKISDDEIFPTNSCEHPSPHPVNLFKRHGNVCPNWIIFQCFQWLTPMSALMPATENLSANIFLALKRLRKVVFWLLIAHVYIKMLHSVPSVSAVTPTTVPTISETLPWN